MATPLSWLECSKGLTIERVQEELHILSIIASGLHGGYDSAVRVSYLLHHYVAGIPFDI